ncbi:unnamed protein product, partial [Darwinula stevensoni]
MTESLVLETMATNRIMDPDGDHHRLVRKSFSAPSAPVLTEEKQDSQNDPSVDEAKEVEEDPSSASDFIMKIINPIGAAVNIFIIWRFPNMVQRHHGGMFFIAYLIMICAIGAPVMHLERYVGVYTKLGPASVWGFAKICKVGFSAAVMALNTATIASWFLVYAWRSCRETLPWSGGLNESELPIYPLGHKYNLPEYFFWNEIGDSLMGIGERVTVPDFRLVLASLVVFSLATISIIRSFRHLPRQTHVFAGLVPPLALIVLLSLSINKEGGRKGLRFFFSFDFSELADSDVSIF